MNHCGVCGNSDVFSGGVSPQRGLGNTLLKLSCNHHICLKCAEDTIKMDSHNACPKCGIFLANDINKLITDHLNDPENKLAFEHGFQNGAVIWTYSGANGKKWAYTRDQCKSIEEAYEEFLIDGTKKEFRLNVSNGSWYILNFDSMQQSNFNDNNKTRNLDRFEMDSYQDIIDNDVIGISGKRI